jgi:hypothetical protein
MTISNQTLERCIEECLQCSRWCAQCRAESLDQDPIMMRDCIRLCNECLELCRTCVTYLRAAPDSVTVCAVFVPSYAQPVRQSAGNPKVKR